MLEVDHQVHTRLLPGGYQIIRDEGGDTFVYHQDKGVVSSRFNTIDEIDIDSATP